jgi:putative peptidoglycan lipid II flippase
MFKKILSVSGFTLLSRLTGFIRDLLMAQFVGAGAITAAFVVAFRLPNHFRAIFAEGAFSSAFVPSYTRSLTQEGESAAAQLHGAILWLMLLVQIIFLGLGYLFTEPLVRLLAPGFAADPEQLARAVALTRITLPYLPLITLVTLWSGVLNAHERFAAAAAAPILLNGAMIAAILWYHFGGATQPFSTGGHALAWGVFVAGFLEAGLLLFAVWKTGTLVRPLLPRLTPALRQFFRAFGPGVIGSGGVQIAMLADTILVTFISASAASTLYFADRIYQLPLGVIAIAGGTVLLPAMSRRIAGGETAAAHLLQARTSGFVLMLAAPCMVGFLMLPDLAVSAAFERGAFTATDTALTASVLMAYGVGLVAAVLIQTARPSFQARGDTVTPMLVAIVAILINVGLKFLLIPHLGVAGLALATSVGAWINLLLLAGLALRGGKAKLDGDFWRMLLAIGIACLALAALFLARPVLARFVGPMTSHPTIALLLVLTVLGALVYFGVLLMALKSFGVSLRRR